MFRKLISVVLVVGQFSIALSASRAHAEASSVNFEASLLKTVLTLKEVRLPVSDFNSQIAAAVGRYHRDSPLLNREARLQSALVDLGILTRHQARRLAAEAIVAQSALEARTSVTEEEQFASVRAQITLISRMGLSGAQFSSCMQTGAILLALAGLVALPIGQAFRNENPSCHPDTANPYPCQIEVCSGVDDNLDCHSEWSSCFHTVCDQPDYRPYRGRGNAILIAGAITIGVSIALSILSDC